ncbi:protein FAR1-RELATED SEQUENCE 5-like [Helianthus annuus]|uniref:protein FAR1-RELATED SEQUENCE 5-like n=1 Tax=Helianthus annuus TaxID=4232 RepID=UPI000B8EF309|nr:protein FAR1-RELATED SEQUENCE 5-like [Helianthus annuus]
MSKYATNTTTSPSDSTTVKPLELPLLKHSFEDSGRGGSGITGEFINPRLFSVLIGMKRMREDDGDAAELRLQLPGDDERIYTPEVEALATPVVGMQFTSIEQAYAFYKSYAKLGGFSTRKGGEVHSGGITKTKYFVCSKEGHKVVCIEDHSSKSKKPYKSKNMGTIRTGCKAHLMICMVDGRLYSVKRFVDGHNHKFVYPHDIHMLPAYSQLMTDKKQYLADYSFEYSVDDDKRLTGLFWADGLCKLNYMEFGDVISFDENFQDEHTLKSWYKIVFVPFTGIDNHYRNVTLGAGLLSSESIESYKWLLNSFLKSFGRQPKVVVTNQDPAMKQAIEEVFPTSRHQLCMWHIMKKVADKVGHELCNNDEFKRKMCDIVWTDSIEPEEFERQWELVMIEFEFMNHFDGAMDVQRFNHRKNDHISRYTEPADWSENTLEKDATKIYTRSIFFDQQIEIHGTISEYLPMDTKIEGPHIRILMKDFKAHGDGLLEVLKGKQQGKQQKKKMKGVQIEKDPRDKDNVVEDDEEEDEFEDYSSDDGSDEEDQWEEVLEDDEED